jgi:hypothetical protein
MYKTNGINPMTYEKVEIVFGCNNNGAGHSGFFIHILKDGNVDMKFLQLSEELFLKLFKRWQINEDFK